MKSLYVTCLSVLGLIIFLPSTYSQSHTATISKQLKLAQAEYDKFNYGKAREITRNLLTLQDTGQQVVKTKIAALTLNANMLYQESLYEEAILVFGVALLMAKSHFQPESIETADAYYNMAWILEQAYAIEEWSNYLDTAEWLYKKTLPPADCIFGKIWNHRARMNYYSFGSTDTTLSRLRKATRIYQSCQGETGKYFYDLHKAYYDVFLALRQFDSAGHYLSLQIDYASAQQGGVWEIQKAWKELSKAHLYRLDGQYEKASSHYRFAHALFEALPVQDTVPLITADLYHALCLNDMGMQEEALRLFRKLVYLRQHYSNISSDVTGLIYEGLAKSYARQGQCDSAILFFKNALTAFKHLVEPSSPKLLSLFHIYSSCLSATGQYQKADSILSFAIQTVISQFNTRHPSYIRLSLEKAFNLIRSGKIADAVRVTEELKHNQGLTAQPEDAYLLTIAEAKILLAGTNDRTALPDKKKLINILSHAMRQFRDLRNQFVTEDARARSVAVSVEALHEFMPVLYDQYIMDPSDDLFQLMLQLSETHRSVILSEAVARTDAYFLAGLPEALQEEELKLKTALSRTRKKLDQELLRAMPKKDHMNRLLAEQIDLQEKLERLIILFREKYPSYYEARFAHQQVSLDEIQRSLPPDAAIIEYMVTGKHLYAFLLRGSDKKIVSINDAQGVMREAMFYARLISNDDGAPQRADMLLLSGQKLYFRLIKPLERSLENVTQLIIIADKALHYLPFELLRSTGHAVAGNKFSDHLMYKYAVQYQPSISMWIDNESEASNLVANTLVVSPAFLSTNNTGMRGNLSAIDHANREGDRIHSFFNGRWLSKTKASKANFMRYAPASDMIHLATHAHADERRGEHSWLAFYPGTSDSLLYMDEIYGMDLRARMVVLSGCETGIGPDQNGEGLISLSRAFTYAGAESIVTSLWPVHDEATSIIMAHFYQFLRQGHTKDRALQLAKLAYLENITDPSQADPYYWAGFIAIGDMTALTFNKPSILPWVMGSIAVAGLFLLAGWTMRKKSILTDPR